MERLEFIDLSACSLYFDIVRDEPFPAVSASHSSFTATADKLTVWTLTHDTTPSFQKPFLILQDAARCT